MPYLRIGRIIARNVIYSGRKAFGGQRWRSYEQTGLIFGSLGSQNS